MLKIMLIAFVSIGAALLLSQIYCLLRDLFILRKLRKMNKELVALLFSLYIREDNIYLFGKTRLLTDIALSKVHEVELRLKTDPQFAFTLAQMQNYKPGGIWEPLSRMPRHVSNFDFKVFTDNHSVFVRDNVTIDNFEEFIRISREGHDLSVLLESFVAEQAEHDSDLKKKYEEVKASPDYIPPEERLKRPGVHIDEQRPSQSEDKPHEE